MKIDFSDINDIGSCFARELRLLKQAIYEGKNKDEISLQQHKIELASLDCQNAILSKMLSETYCSNDFEILRSIKEDLDVDTITDQ